MIKSTFFKRNIYAKHLRSCIAQKPWRHFCENSSKQRNSIIKNIEERCEGQTKEFYSYTVYEDKLIPILEKVQKDQGNLSKYIRRVTCPIITLLGFTQKSSFYLGPSFIYLDYFLLSQGTLGLAYLERKNNKHLNKIDKGIWKIDLNKDMESVMVYVGGLAKENSFCVKICDIDVISEEDLSCKIAYKDKNSQNSNESDVYIELNERVDFIFEQANNSNYTDMVTIDYVPIPNEMLLHYIIFGITEEVKKFSYKEQILEISQIIERDLKFIEESSETHIKYRKSPETHKTR